MDEKGLLLTQWRPIPNCAVERAEAQMNRLEGDCPPPYASTTQVEGILHCLAKPLKDCMDDWVAQIDSIQRDGGILLVRYGTDSVRAGYDNGLGAHGQIASLFEVLDATSEAKLTKLPPLIVVVDPNRPWSHLHAITAEDNRVPFAGYLDINSLNDAVASEGSRVAIAPDERGWAIISHA